MTPNEQLISLLFMKGFNGINLSNVVTVPIGTMLNSVAQ